MDFGTRYGGIPAGFPPDFEEIVNPLENDGISGRGFLFPGNESLSLTPLEKVCILTDASYQMQRLCLLRHAFGCGVE